MTQRAAWVCVRPMRQALWSQRKLLRALHFGRHLNAQHHALSRALQHDQNPAPHCALCYVRGGHVHNDRENGVHGARRWVHRCVQVFRLRSAVLPAH